MIKNGKHKFPDGKKEFEIKRIGLPFLRWTMIAKTKEIAWHKFTKLSFRRNYKSTRDDYTVLEVK